MLEMGSELWRGNLISFFAKASVFAVCFLAVIGIIHVLPNTDTFWRVLSLKFSQDERYQLQNLFLPDEKRMIPFLLVGDGLFQTTVQDGMVGVSPPERIFINSYDPDDLGAVFKGLKMGSKNTQTQICNLLVQVSPLFSLRAKADGAGQHIRLMRNVFYRQTLEDSVKTFFDILVKWANTRRNIEMVLDRHGRPKRMVGQARFASDDVENWNYAFGGVGDFKGKVIAVLDTRKTDWGKDSDLISATIEKLDALTTEHQHVSWVSLDEVATISLDECS